MADSFLLGIIIIGIGGIISGFAKEKHGPAIFSFFVFCGIILVLIPSFRVIINNGVVMKTLFLNFPIGEVKIIIDPLASFFIIFTSIMSLISSIYSTGYLRSYLDKKRPVSSHNFFLGLLISSMILIVSIQNALAFLIIWEIMSISSFFLVVFENEKKEVFDAGVNYLITMHVGVVFLIIGFILMINLTGGSADFETYKTLLNKNKEIANLIFMIFFIGFGIKAGFIPLHTWLPKAHPASPSNVSGMMSGIMIKIGIYGILRILTLIGSPGPGIGFFILVISLVSGVLGIMYAIIQHDYKKLLAYSSVENIGIIGIGIGLGMIGMSYNNKAMCFFGFLGSFLHILNHSIFKMLLFYSSGAIYQQTHTRDIDSLGGLIRKMKFTSIFFLIGSLSITGVPPFNGFAGEFLIYTGMINGINTDNLFLSIFSILSTGLLAFIGAMALLCFTKVFGIIFLGNPRMDSSAEAREIRLPMIIPMVILSAFCVLIGLFPGAIIHFLKPVVSVFSPDTQEQFGNTMNLLNNVSIYFFIFFIILITFILFRFFLLRKRKVVHFRTWDCGYGSYNPRMQYTSSSFSKSFLFLIDPLIRKQQVIKKPEGLFPAEASFDSHANDFYETYFINPAIKFINKFLDLFTWIQSGNTQKYIFYGLVFLVAIIFLIIISGLF